VTVTFNGEPISLQGMSTEQMVQIIDRVHQQWDECWRQQFPDRFRNDNLPQGRRRDRIALDDTSAGGLVTPSSREGNVMPAKPQPPSRERSVMPRIAPLPLARSVMRRSWQ
jgi:hypothetical protein